jgi:phosphonate transport system permease protein
VTQVAEARTRPVPPLRAYTLLPGLLTGLVLLVAGGMTALTASGIIWGVLAAGGVLLAFRVAKLELSNRETVVLGLAVLASCVVTAAIVSDVPEALGVLLALSVGGAWALTGIAAGWILRERGARPFAAINGALAWIGAGIIALPAANTFDVFTPLSRLSRNAPEPELGAGVFVVVSLAVGLIGLASTLGAVGKIPVLGVVSAVIFGSVFAGAEVGFSLGGLLRDFRNIVNVPNFWPPDFAWAIGEGTWWWPPTWEFGSTTRANPLIETFRISIVASVIGCGVALPVAFMASKITAPNNPVYLIDKGVMSLIRTVPDLFWALLFVAALGVGPLAGALALVFFSLGIMGKLFSETIDAVDVGPLEAARSTGAAHFPAVRSAVLPQVLPNYVAYALYIFEINIRASVVIGLAGAGGIGRVLEAQRSFFQFDRVLAIVILIFVIVFVIEQISVALRRRLV